VALLCRSTLSGERKVALRNGLSAQYVVQCGHLNLLMLEAAG
jgi:hypothetical protein